MMARPGLPPAAAAALARRAAGGEPVAALAREYRVSREAVYYHRRRAGYRGTPTRRGVGAGNRNAPPPAPTAHPPGSPGKVAVLAERAAAGVGLFHPDDARVGERSGAA